jgi:hypothetical protein
MMFNEDIRSTKSFQHKKYTINRYTFILTLFMINLTIDLYYYNEYVNMYLVNTYNMARCYFHIVILSVFLYKSACIFLQSNTYLFVPHNYTSSDRFTKVIVNRKSKITLTISLRARIRAFH